MVPEHAISEATAGHIRPVYLVIGEERMLVDRVVAAIRDGVLRGGESDFNQETLVAGEASVDALLAAARMLPMMAPRRFLLVRSLDRWDAAAEKSATKEKSAGVSPMDRLVAYVQKPVESTCMVLTAAKLDRRRKLVAVAKKADFLVECEPLSREALPGFIKQEVAKRGHKMERGVADHLAEIAGPDLSAVVDAVERLSLYVGEGGTITEESVAICVTRIRPSSVWDLLGSIGRRDAARALAVLAEVYEPQDRGLRLVGLLSWSTRQLLRFILASRAGATPQEAAVAAGAPPFKARELAGQAKNFNAAEIEQWLYVLAETDRMLKGSRRPPCAILESSILTMTVGLPK